MRKQVYIALAAAVLLLVFSGCRTENPELVFLPENGTPTAYLVLSRDYGGSVLLLRREILPDPLPYADDDDSYYAGSVIDRWLCETFPQRFPPEIRDEMQTVPIAICCRFPDNSRTETIERAMFLPSATEAGIDMDIVTVEGAPLPALREPALQQALCGEDPAGWWLRSAYVADRGLAWHISANGTVGGRPLWQPSGVRPAVCISRQLLATLPTEGPELVHPPFTDGNEIN